MYIILDEIHCIQFQQYSQKYFPSSIVCNKCDTKLMIIIGSIKRRRYFCRIALGIIIGPKGATNSRKWNE